MSEARPSHAFALIPFRPDPVTGRDDACEKAVDAWVLARGKDYALDAPRLVETQHPVKDEVGSRGPWFFMYLSGNLVEYVHRQIEVQVDVQVFSAELQQRKAETMDRPRLAGVVPAGAGMVPPGPRAVRR